MNEPYLKETRQVLGELTPRIVNKNGVVADGKHRGKVYPKWETIVKPWSDLETYAARLVINTQRRIADEADYNECAEELARVEPGAKRWLVKSGIPVSARIHKLTGIPEDTIRENLDPKYKDPNKEHASAGVTPAGLGESHVMRVPRAIAGEVEAYSESLKRTARKSPKLGAELVRSAKRRLRGQRVELDGIAHMPDFLKKLVASGKLPLDVGRLIVSKVPEKFREREAAFLVKTHMPLVAATTYVISQGPSYKAHQRSTDSPKPKAPNEVYGNPLPLLVIREVEVSSVRDGKIWFKEKNREVTLDEKIAVAVQPKVKAGDKLLMQITVTPKIAKTVIAAHQRNLRKNDQAPFEF
jgi:hypothetical protein